MSQTELCISALCRMEARATRLWQEYVESL